MLLTRWVAKQKRRLYVGLVAMVTMELFLLWLMLSAEHQHFKPVGADSEGVRSKENVFMYRQSRDRV